MSLQKPARDCIPPGMSTVDVHSLAAPGDASKEAAARRLRAARAVTGLSQEALGRAVGVGKTTISNAEKGLAYPGRSTLVYLYNHHGIDFNFMIVGAYSHLPAPTKEALLSALAAEAQRQAQIEN